MNKYEETIATCTNNQVMVLIATRLHRFANVDSDDVSGMKNLKLSFMTSGNAKKTELIVTSNNFSVLHPAYVRAIKSLIKEYFEELIPFFMNLKDKDLNIVK